MTIAQHLEYMLLHLVGKNGFVTEYKFHPDRRWRFDFAIPELKLAFEAEGGVWTRGRHTRPTGYIKDCEKYNAAMDLGWKVYRFAEVPKIDYIEGVITKEMQYLLSKEVFKVQSAEQIMPYLTKNRQK